ncbi:MAG: NusG domain II-containing protein [Bacillota bacterium]|jgi:hypothetical protein
MTKRKIMPAILMLLLGALLIFAGARGRQRAPKGSLLTVTSIGEAQNRVVAEVVLTPTEKRTIRVEGPLGITVVEVEGTRAHVVSSPCPDKICIRMGWLERAGDYAACLPNRVLVEVGDE